MPQYHVDDNEKTALLGPPCPECGVPMMLTRIVPEEIGREARTYECSLCDRAATQSVVTHDGVA